MFICKQMRFRLWPPLVILLQVFVAISAREKRVSEDAGIVAEVLTLIFVCSTRASEMSRGTLHRAGNMPTGQRQRVRRSAPGVFQVTE